MRPFVYKESLERFIRANETILKHVPSAKKQALYAAATAAQKVVRQQITQRVDDSRGRVKRWQEVLMGSKGGYSKVAPSDVQVTGYSGKYYGYTAADITRYLERGHGVPSPSGKNDRYNPRLEKAAFNGSTGKAYVAGRMFYSWAKTDAEKAAIAAAWEAMDQIGDDYADLLADLD